MERRQKWKRVREGERLMETETARERERGGGKKKKEILNCTRTEDNTKGHVSQSQQTLQRACIISPLTTRLLLRVWRHIVQAKPQAPRMFFCFLYFTSPK